MKKQVLMLLVAGAFVVNDSSAYQSNAVLFKKMVSDLGKTETGKVMCNNMLTVYKQVLDMMMGTRDLCRSKQNKKDVASVKADFMKPLTELTNKMAARISQFKTMQAEQLLMPLHAILTEVINSQQDFESVLSWGIVEMQKHMA